ncbi:hypothetical protein GW12_13050 [Acinetobacter sp. HR7]|nr:hypothetical protein GW12_13050 [Acinetobacter sp. HR7]
MNGRRFKLEAFISLFKINKLNEKPTNNVKSACQELSAHL